MTSQTEGAYEARKPTLRVLMLSQFPLSEADQGRGGVMQATQQLVRALSDLNEPELELHVLSLNEECTAPQTQSVGRVTVHYVPKSRFPAAITFVEPFRVVVHMLRLWLTVRPRVVHAQGNVTFLLLSLCFGKRGVQTIHGVFRNEQPALRSKRMGVSQRVHFFFRQALESFYLWKMRNLIAITDQIAQLATAAGVGKRIYRINNAVDAAFFAGRKTVRADKPLVVLFVGVLTPRKGVHILLQAFARLANAREDVQLRVVGSCTAAPEYVETLKAGAAEMLAKRRIVFTGAVDSPTLMREFQECDLLVLPSLGESAPLVISQAMCLGLPVVATRVGGIPEMVEHGLTGMLVPPGESEPLADALMQLLDDPQLRHRLGAAARGQAVERYLPRSVAQATLRVYQEVSK